VKVSSTLDEVQFAYSELSQDDRDWIDKQAALLERRIKEIWMKKRCVTKAQFGRMQALELLYQLGRFMRREGI
jgi:hypothetical protein